MIQLISISFYQKDASLHQQLCSDKNFIKITILVSSDIVTDYIYTQYSQLCLSDWVNSHLSQILT